MNQVLLIDVAPSLSNYIAGKLHDRGVAMLYADGVDKGLEIMVKTKIALVIIDYSISRDVLFDFLARKQTNPQIAKIPLIALVREVNKKDVSLLVSYNVKKVLSKPLRIDELLTSIGNLLKITFSFDDTPCILDIRVNEDIIIIELAQGLNRDKIEILQFRINELVDLYALASPKILIMMADLDITYGDAANLEYLINTILAIKIIVPENIKILTLNKFILQFFQENPDYKHIEVVSSFENALSALVQKNEEEKMNMAQAIFQNEDTARKSGGTIETRFKLDSIGKLSIAAVDDDVVVRQMMQTIFSSVRAKVSVFEDGESFLETLSEGKYDVVFLDIMMPGMNGMDVAIKMKQIDAKTPVVILSSVAQRDVVFEALQKGIKRYLIKPIKPELILRKTKEILGVNV